MLDPMETVKAANARIASRRKKNSANIQSILDALPDETVAPSVVPAGSASTTTPAVTAATSSKSGKPLANDNLTKVLAQAGFSGEALRVARAVVMAESGGDARQLTASERTRDLSYGLFQINMRGDMGPERRKAYNLKSNEDLYDPLINAKIAFKMSGGGKNWQPWTAYKNGSYRKFL